MQRSFSSSGDQKDFFVAATVKAQTLNNVWQNGKILSFLLGSSKHSKGHYMRETSSNDGEKKRLKWPLDGYRSTLWETGDIMCNVPKSQDNSPEPAVGRKSLWNNIQKQLQGSLSGEKVNLNMINDEIVKTINFDSRLIPIMLVRHRTGMNVQSVHERDLEGWTIILHANHANDMVVTFSLKGAVPIGTEELEHLRMAEGVPSFPRDFLDSPSGHHFWKQKEHQLEVLKNGRPVGKQQVDHCSSISNLLGDCAKSGKDMTVVRNYMYLQAFSPPTSSKNLVHENILQIESLISNVQLQQGDHCNNCSLQPLPSLPNLTFVHVTLKSLGRGLPRPAASIFAPTHKELLLFVKHHLLHKKKLQSAANQRGESKELHQAPTSKSWRGVEVASLLSSNRLLLGVVTSGHQRHCNRGDHYDALALCDVEKVFEMTANKFELFGHPSSHKVVLFLNPGSSILRPAYIEYL